MLNFSDYHFAPVMNYPEPEKMKVFDFTKGYDADYIRSFDWGIGRYDEKRQNMYTTSQFEGKRNIHMAIDLWSSAGRPVYSFYDGQVAYLQNNDADGDYGPTLIIKYDLKEQSLFVLYGHLAESTLEQREVGETIKKGQQVASIGTESVNGGWAPHLHFQLSLKDPGEGNMPGVVADEDHAGALQTYPDPRLVLGPLY